MQVIELSALPVAQQAGAISWALAEGKGKAFAFEVGPDGAVRILSSLGGSAAILRRVYPHSITAP